MVDAVFAAVRHDTGLVFRLVVEHEEEVHVHVVFVEIDFGHVKLAHIVFDGHEEDAIVLVLDEAHLLGKLVRPELALVAPLAMEKIDAPRVATFDKSGAIAELDKIEHREGMGLGQTVFVELCVADTGCASRDDVFVLLVRVKCFPHVFMTAKKIVHIGSIGASVH